MADNIREDRSITGKNYTDSTEDTYEAFLKSFAEEYVVITVLKGHGTIIASPGGRALLNTTLRCLFSKH